MIVNYHRPETIDAALHLLHQYAPSAKPMGGGTVLNQPGGELVTGVDLQLLGLTGSEMKGTSLHLGACLNLQGLLELALLPPALHDAIKLEATYNLRQAATLAGCLVASNGRSSLATALLALDASVQILRHQKKPLKLTLGELLPVREEKLSGALISEIVLPSNAQLAFQSVARTPTDLPIVCVAVAAWQSGRTRIVVGGWGQSPLLAMDGPESSGGQIAAENSCSQAGDEWASAVYRQHSAGVLTRRCLEELQLSLKKR